MQQLRTLMVSGFFLIAIGCGPANAPPLKAPPVNVIFVLVDTLRADHTSLYGYERPTTPFLEELGAESAVFERARAQAGCTFPSVNSILTSRYPFDFYRKGFTDMGIPEEFPSMAEILKDHGYTTAAISASPIVRATPSDHNPSAGFGRGFDVFDEECLWESADCVNDRALEYLRETDEPFFLYLHYMDPHDPYRPPEDHERRFGVQDTGRTFIDAGNPNPIAEMLYDDGPTVDFSESEFQHLVDLYDDEIRYFDTMLRQLVTSLRDAGTLQRSILILTSDHGEEFLEHGQVKHCRGIWDTLTRVPLIMRFPEGRATRIPATPVQLVDLLPTLIDYLGVPDGGIEMEGISLRPVLEGGTSATTIAFSDQERYRSSDNGRFHLVFDGLGWEFTLFDTHADPFEQRNLLETHSREAKCLEDALNHWLVETGQWEHFDITLRAAEAQHEQLRALGYLE